MNLLLPKLIKLVIIDEVIKQSADVKLLISSGYQGQISPVFIWLHGFLAWTRSH